MTLSSVTVLPQNVEVVAVVEGVHLLVDCSDSVSPQSCSGL